MDLPKPGGTFEEHSNAAPASVNARSRKSLGASGNPCNTANTSRASNDGPMPWPTGCDPSVNNARTTSPNSLPTSSSDCFRRSAID